MVFTCAVSCAIAFTVAICHSSGRLTSVVGVALFLPGIAADVVAERLPEAGRVLVHETQAADPFRALPEIKVRDDESRRTAVLGRERLAVVLVRDERLPVEGVRQEQVRGVPAVARSDERDRARVELDVLEERVHGDAAPARVE